jgi:multiple sugar transport system substrate-binding protein
LAVLLVVTLVAACGQRSTGGSGPAQLNFFIFNEPGQGPQTVAKQCSDQSGGRYRISFSYLPARADQQREQLVRRLGAKDDTIDIVGMDIIWTGEFANAGWIAPVPDSVRPEVTRNVFPSVLKTAQFEDRMYAVPIWSNTELLWYRKDKVKAPPQTWDQMIDEAVRQKSTVQVQGNRYEGLVVWTNAMIESAGTHVLRGPSQLELAKGPTEKALATMGKLATSPAAPTDIDTSNEDSARLGFEAGSSIFMINYPFVYPSAKENAPDVFKNMGAAKYPEVVAGRPSAPPLGGINIAVASYSPNKTIAWEAVKCMVRPEHQITIAEKGGLPPVREDIYDQPEIQKIYPGFADIIRRSIADAASRPSESPAYQDLSLGIQRGVHPTSKIDPKDPGPTYDRLRTFVEQAVKREGLL